MSSRIPVHQSAGRGSRPPSSRSSRLSVAPIVNGVSRRIPPAYLLVLPAALGVAIYFAWLPLEPDTSYFVQGASLFPSPLGTIIGRLGGYPAFDVVNALASAGIIVLVARIAAELGRPPLLAQGFALVLVGGGWFQHSTVDALGVVLLLAGALASLPGAPRGRTRLRSPCSGHPPRHASAHTGGDRYAHTEDIAARGHVGPRRFPRCRCRSDARDELPARVQRSFTPVRPRRRQPRAVPRMLAASTPPADSFDPPARLVARRRVGSGRDRRGCHSRRDRPGGHHALRSSVPVRSRRRARAQALAARVEHTKCELLDAARARCRSSQPRLSIEAAE